MSISSEIDTISQNYRFAKRLNLLAKVILFGVSPYYLAKPKPFGESQYTFWQNSNFLAKVYIFSQKFYLLAKQWGFEKCVLRQIKSFLQQINFGVSLLKKLQRLDNTE